MLQFNQSGKEGKLWNDVHDVEDVSEMISGSVPTAVRIRVLKHRFSEPSSVTFGISFFWWEFSQSLHG